jgi:hypothetical protein
MAKKKGGGNSHQRAMQAAKAGAKVAAAPAAPNVVPVVISPPDPPQSTLAFKAWSFVESNLFSVALATLIAGVAFGGVLRGTIMVVSWLLFAASVHRSSLLSAYKGKAKIARQVFVTVLIGLPIGLIDYYVPSSAAVLPPQIRPPVSDTQSNSTPSRPMLRGTVNQVTKLKFPKLGLRYLVRMTIINDGEETAVFGFVLHVIKDGKELMVSNAMEIDDVRFLTDVGGGKHQQVVLQKADSLAYKGHFAVRKGVPLSGFLMYVPKVLHISDKQADHFQDADVKWVIDFYDYKENKYQAPVSFEKDANKIVAPFTIPAD